jgi:hypothetical protein
MQYNCKRWITRFAGRWRTQLAALSGVKCRTRRALDFRTHIAASGLSRGFVCLRVGMKLKTLYKSVLSSMPYKLLYSSDLFIHQTANKTRETRCALMCSRSELTGDSHTAEHYTFCCGQSYYSSCSMFSFEETLESHAKTVFHSLRAESLVNGGRSKVFTCENFSLFFVDLRSSEITR